MALELGYTRSLSATARAMLSDKLINHIRDVKRTSITIDAGRLAVVIDNLRFLHDSIVASEQLLTEAAEGIGSLPRVSFHERLAEYYRSHLDEEHDHVKWLREDLESVGVSMNVGHADRFARQWSVHNII